MQDKINKGLKKINGSKDGKTLLTNFGYLSLLQIAGYIFPLFTLPFLARVIGVDNFGNIAFAAAVIVWFQTIADWGFNFTATRDVAQHREDKEKVSQIFSNVFWARCVLMVLSFILLCGIIFLVPKFRENQTILLITFLIVPGQIMFPDWFFQALEKMKYITILNIVSKLIFTIAVFVFIKEKSDFVLQPLLTSLGYLFSGFFAMYIILFRWKYKLQKPVFSEVFRTIKGSTDVFLNNLVPNLYFSFSTLLLGFYGGSIANGKLDAGSRFTNIFQQFMNVLARTFYPFLSRRIEKHDLYVKMNVILSILFSSILFICAPLLIKIFFTPEFYEAVVVLRVLAFSIVLISIRNAYGTHYLILKGYSKELRNMTFIGSFVGFVLAFPLIYYFNFIGAAVNIIFSQFIMAITVVIKARKVKKIN